MRIANSPKDLALMVVDERKKLKLSQSQVANFVGLKQKTISEFENKPEKTQLETLFKIMSAVKLDMLLIVKNEVIENKGQWTEEW